MKAEDGRAAVAAARPADDARRSAQFPARRGCENGRRRAKQRRRESTPCPRRYGWPAKITSPSWPCGDLRQDPERAVFPSRASTAPAPARVPLRPARPLHLATGSEIAPPQRLTQRRPALFLSVAPSERLTHRWPLSCYAFEVVGPEALGLWTCCGVAL